MENSERTGKESCNLQNMLGIDTWCSKERCIYWRLLSTQDIEISKEQGCGITHNGLLERLSPEMVKWLISIKNRLESADPEIARSRINFHRRKK